MKNNYLCRKSIEHKTIQGDILFEHSSLHEQAVLPAVKVIQQEIWTNISLIPSILVYYGF